jgi:hypothetical protein
VFRDLRGKVNSRSLKTRDLAEAKKSEKNFMAILNEARRMRSLSRTFPMFKEIAPAPLPTARSNRLKLSKMLEIAGTRREIKKEHISAMKHLIERTKLKYADEITPKVALNYLETYYNKGNGKTYNNTKSALNTVFRCCLVEANLEQSPFQVIMNKKITEVDGRRNLTDEEISRLMAIMPEPLQLMTMLSRWTAQRLETCARMTPGMFNFETKVFIIKPSKTARFNKYVCCPIMPELEEYIKPLLLRCSNPDEPILYQITTGYRNNHKISEYFSEYCEKAQIEHKADDGKVGFHSLRGSAITYFKNLGMSSDDLRLMTGHTTDLMESKYDRSSEQISRFALSMQPERDK